MIIIIIRGAPEGVIFENGGKRKDLYKQFVEPEDPEIPEVFLNDLYTAEQREKL